MSAAGMQYFGATSAGGTYYGDLITAVRDLLDAVSVTDAPDDLVRQTVGDLRRINAQLSEHAVAAGELFPAGHRFDLAGRGHPLAIPIEVLELTESTMRGRTRFETAHMGHLGIAHGGSVAYLFDEALGVFPMRVSPPPRTAWLRVDYRQGAPVHTDLCVDVRLTAWEGRKMTIHGSLHDGVTTFAESEGLFVQPRE